MNQEDLIKEYMINGGQTWSLVTIDTYRDGGTKVLQTSVPKNELKYYINHKTYTLHGAYPPDESNIITDKSIIAYIMYRIDKYKEDIEYKMREVLSIQENLSVEGIRDRKINEILDK
jgi:hypothetical protein